MPRHAPFPNLALIISLALAAPLARAADTRITLYHADDAALFAGTGSVDAGHALVHEARRLEIQRGPQTLRFDGLPAPIDAETIRLDFAPGASLALGSRRLVLASPGANESLAGATGRRVSVLIDATGAPTRDGVLLGVSEHGLLLRGDDGSVQLIHRYAAVKLPAAVTTQGSSWLLNVTAASAGARDARLSYMTSGLGWRAAYTATLENGGACRMHFAADASIANRSGRDYHGVELSLIAGQPNLDDQRTRSYRMPAPMLAAASELPEPAALGDYRSFSLPGRHDLPTGTLAQLPLYAEKTLTCQRQYVLNDGGAGFPARPNTNDFGSQDYRDRPLDSALSFIAADALPAGNLRAWLADRQGDPTLLGQGCVADTPQGQRLTVQLGQSFDLRASRERTAFHVDARQPTMREAYRITLRNGGAQARTVSVLQHPNRWRQWTLTSANRKPVRQTTQQLEFDISVPAHGQAVLEYALRYDWTLREP